MSTTSANLSGLYTRALAPDRSTEIDVGELRKEGVADPGAVWPVKIAGPPYIFLSHRGPDVKEEIVRPTSWFLSTILNVKTFFDAKTMPAGDDKTLSLIEPAHRCTHAVVILSPFFRNSRYCVMELNTFMARHQKGVVNLIPVLWQQDIDDAYGYAPALKEINWHKPSTWNAPTFMVEDLWPFLVKTLERKDEKIPPFQSLLREYIQKMRTDETSPPIPKSIEIWLHNNVILEDLQKSLSMGQDFQDNPNRDLWRSDSGGSVASVFSSCSSITNDVDTKQSSSLSFKHVPIKAFGRSSDRSFITDYFDDPEWKYNWQRSPKGIGRDEANAFFYNAYVTYFKVQRVLVVDEKAKQIMVCTPMNYAAYYIMKVLREDKEMTVNRAYEGGVIGGVKGEQLDKAFIYMHYRRCKDGRNIVYSKEESTLTVRAINDGTRRPEKEWIIDNLPPNGSWGNFLCSILKPKIEWVSVVHGETGVRNNNSRDVWTLVFRNEEAELLMGEPRKFGSHEGLQFRGGTFGTFFRNQGSDKLVIPKGGKIIFKGNSDWRKLEMWERRSGSSTLTRFEMDSMNLSAIVSKNSLRRCHLRRRHHHRRPLISVASLDSSTLVAAAAQPLQRFRQILVGMKYSCRILQDILSCREPYVVHPVRTTKRTLILIIHSRETSRMNTATRPFQKTQQQQQ